MLICFKNLSRIEVQCHLDLSKMTMTDEAIDALENGIMSKYSLQTLDISGALVSASGAD